MMKHFTPAETKLFQTLGHQWLIDAVNQGSIVEPKAYDLAAMEAFAENHQGPEVEALRRAVKALRSGSVYRHTAEFDNLCSF